MSSSFIPMDAPNQPPAGAGAAELPQVCALPGAGESAAPPQPVRRDPGAATTANLRAGLASRLRAAYERGAELDQLAVASHQSVAEVEQLLLLAGVDPTAERRPRPALDRAPGVVPQPRPQLEELLTDGGSAQASGEPLDQDEVSEGWRPSPARARPRIRRPAPPRRSILRAGSPIAGAANPAATDPAAAGLDAADPAAGNLDPARLAEAAAASSSATPAASPGALTTVARAAGGQVAGGPAVGGPAVGRPVVGGRPVGGWAADAQAGEAPAAIEPPLGILIGGPRVVPGIGGRLEDQRCRRVTAQLIRVGQGTTLAVLPSWRPSIAISVPTELLLTATGLNFEELGRAELTVLINAEALHDRELRPRDWQVAPEHGGGRRRRG
ncbi:hypothetical protein OG455_26160 [Kitasatospora sp. NBC_01287]|uniref:hypothetical protein n=1 Tax=Kitasatospora sp. NBC_01287 TaxID=2903573 RepID=UPI00224D1D59|nr:hypothetical protein [Kitasatospora sp. NBC_01287]MCX4748956.1 hypothetical protein [Kitasatospora sp. NBC_01287]